LFFISCVAPVDWTWTRRHSSWPQPASALLDSWPHSWPRTFWSRPQYSATKIKDFTTPHCTKYTWKYEQIQRLYLFQGLYKAM